MQHSSSVGPSFLLILLLSLSNFYSAIAQGDSKDWPQWRGPNQSGALSDPGFSCSKDALVLQVAWEKPLGSGYSGISVADGRAVTMFSDDTFDYLIAIDANNGDELWRFRIDSTYLGHGGSDNGPSSTPAIADGQVFAIGRKGHLLALDVKDGEKIWSRHLVNDDNAKAPFYGFATSPIVYEDILVVQTQLGSDRKVAKWNNIWTIYETHLLLMPVDFRDWLHSCCQQRERADIFTTKDGASHSG